MIGSIGELRFSDAVMVRQPPTELASVSSCERLRPAAQASVPTDDQIERNSLSYTRKNALDEGVKERLLRIRS